MNIINKRIPHIYPATPKSAYRIRRSTFCRLDFVCLSSPRFEIRPCPKSIKKLNTYHVNFFHFFSLIFYLLYMPRSTKQTFNNIEDSYNCWNRLRSRRPQYCSRIRRATCPQCRDIPIKYYI